LPRIECSATCVLNVVKLPAYELNVPEIVVQDEAVGNAYFQLVPSIICKCVSLLELNSLGFDNRGKFNLLLSFLTSIAG
jgi:hypothetical protein